MALLSVFEIVAVLLVLTAAFSWFNYVVLRLPNTIGLLVMALASSLLLVGLEVAFPQAAFFHEMSLQVRRIDFTEAVLQVMLGYLLFAGALQVDVSELRDRKVIVGTMASLGLFISTLAVGTMFWLAARAIGAPISFLWSLVFGALISPTDPVAVLSTLKEVNVPHRLQMDMSGESLFNDGVGVALFTVLLAAASAGEGSFGFGKLAAVIFREAAGGGALGLIAGFIAYRAMRHVDEYTIEVLISLAIATGTYALATRLEVSGPIAVVVAGVILGSRGAEVAMSRRTQRYMFGFWQLVDDMLNSVLFLLIGLEVLVLQFDSSLLPLALAAVPIVLLGRFIAVAIPIRVLSARCGFDRGTVPMLTWGGVRGGISIALVLSIPDDALRQPLAAATYMVAIFTIVVQGMSLAWLARRLGVGSAQ